MAHISLLNHPEYLVSFFLSSFFIPFLKRIFFRFYLSKKLSNARYEKREFLLPVWTMYKKSSPLQSL
jgi:hypothetical protein